MQNFVAIDFEIANPERTSICSVGCVKVVDGVIADTFYELVRPVPNFYYRGFTAIHGIIAADTAESDTFDAVWPKMKSFIGNLPVVAHNAPFDSGCLRATLKYYGFSRLDNEFYCTLQAARRAIPRSLCASFSLPSLAGFLGIPFNNHHNALADAEACAKIALILL